MRAVNALQELFDALDKIKFTKFFYEQSIIGKIVLNNCLMERVKI